MQHGHGPAGPAVGQLPTRPAGPPASATPIADLRSAVAAEGPRGIGSIDGDYCVLPWQALQALPLPMQQHLRGLLEQIRSGYAGADWPIYRVLPCQVKALHALTAAEERDARVSRDINDTGAVRFYDLSSGAEVEDTQQRLVARIDPLARWGRT